MVRRWANAPSWKLGIVSGLSFGVFTGAFLLVRGEPTEVALITAAVDAVIFGAVMGRFAARQRDRELAALAEGTSRYVKSSRALHRGPLPLDPDERATALRLGEQRLETSRRQRRWGLPILLVALVIYVVLAVVSSPWWWLAVAAFVGILALDAWQRRALGRRVAQLRMVTGPQERSLP